MPRKNPEKEAERARKAELWTAMQGMGVTDVDSVKELFKEMVGMVLENGLEGELDEELGYTKYDYREKATANSRNGHSSKHLRTSMGELEISVPRESSRRV